MPETHHTSMLTVIHSVNQGLELKAGQGDFDVKEAPKEIGPRMVVTVMTSPTSQTSTGIEEGEIETVTADGKRVKQKPNNNEPTRGETKVKMTLYRMKGSTVMIQHEGSSKQYRRHFHTPTEANLAKKGGKGRRVLSGIPERSTTPTEMTRRRPHRKILRGCPAAK